MTDEKKGDDEIDELIGDDMGDDDMADEIDVDEAPVPEKPPEKPQEAKPEAPKEPEKPQEAPPLVAAPPKPAALPVPAPIPWHVFELQDFDCMTKRIASTRELLQNFQGGMSDEIQMFLGDRIVVTLIKADGKKYKVYDKRMEEASARLFVFKISLWLYGVCALPTHMQQGSSLTPSGYR